MIPDGLGFTSSVSTGIAIAIDIDYHEGRIDPVFFLVIHFEKIWVKKCGENTGNQHHP